MQTPNVAALAGLILMLLPSCAPLTYSKAGMTNDDVSRDLSECTEIAMHEAFRDFEASDFRFAILHPRVNDRDRFLHADIGHSPSELQHRYQRVCMLARGYRLSPIDE